MKTLEKTMYYKYWEHTHPADCERFPDSDVADVLHEVGCTRYHCLQPKEQMVREAIAVECIYRI